MAEDVRRWFEFTFNDFAVHIHDHHVFWVHFLITYSTGFDHYQSRLRVTRTDVAPRPDDKVIPGQFQVQVHQFFFKISSIGPPGRSSLKLHVYPLASDFDCFQPLHDIIGTRGQNNRAEAHIRHTAFHTPFGFQGRGYISHL